jgi:poly(A) polymerase
MTLANPGRRAILEVHSVFSYLDVARLDTSISPAEWLSEILLTPDPTDALWEAVNSGKAEELLPELPALLLEQDPIHQHKDVLAHTIAVTAKTEPRLTVRLAALFHDIGKPKTRAYIGGEVTFRHHEAVGSRITRKRMTKMDFDEKTVNDVTRLVFLSGRFKGYANGWSDSAVRRYARDAGPLLGDLNHLVRSDTTSRNPRTVASLHRNLDHLEQRIADLAREDAKARERPDLSGDEVMEYLSLPPGPDVGKALAFLMKIKRTEGTLDREMLLKRLDRWWVAQNE